MPTNAMLPGTNESGNGHLYQRRHIESDREIAAQTCQHEIIQRAVAFAQPCTDRKEQPRLAQAVRLHLDGERIAPALISRTLQAVEMLTVAEAAHGEGFTANHLRLMRTREVRAAALLKDAPAGSF